MPDRYDVVDDEGETLAAAGAASVGVAVAAAERPEGLGRMGGGARFSAPPLLLLDRFAVPEGFMAATLMRTRRAEE